ncbi:HNH endonuclease [Rhodococcus erythropolis]|uniref:HNH endonuclease n=1 Tax=Rhodococcus erythropolis TaxID=1833 RepID=UPI00366B4768
MSRRADGTLHGTYHNRTCTHCGHTFRTRKADAKYCGYRCVNLARYDRTGRVSQPGPASKVYPRTCELCRQPFIARHCDVDQCPTCSASVKAWRVFITECATCSTLFTCRYTRRTCSPQCATAHKAAVRREAEHRRRARKRNAYVANVTRRTVYERDRWKCHLCGKAINRKATAPHPKSPTIDHVIPLASGGTHEPLNCRAAHFLCNSLKGNRGGGEQLLLVA